MRLILIGLLTLLSCAGPVAAQGLNLNWRDCTLGAPAYNPSGDCATDVGAPYKLVASIDPAGVIDQVVGMSGVISLTFEAPVVPGFWQMQPGGVREGALQIDPLIGSANAPFSCPEPWSQAGSQAAAVSYSLGPGPNEARIEFTVSVPGPVTLASYVAPDWFLVAFDILRDGTTTSGGCAANACLVFDYIIFQRTPGAPGGDIVVCQPAVNNHAAWNHPIACPRADEIPPPRCPNPTPTFEPSWGSLKQMYR